MKILLLNPPFIAMYSRQSRSPCVAKSGTIYYPYYLAYAAGSLRKCGYDVKLLDSIILEYDKEQTISAIIQYKPDMVMIATSTPSIYNDIFYANEIKKINDKIKTCLVGTHPTNLPDETMMMSKSIDYILRGEYDYTIRDLVDAIKNKKDLDSVPGLTYREDIDGVVRHNENAELPTSKMLDELPYVSEVYYYMIGRDAMYKYLYASIKWPYLSILSARGCPYNCSFCNVPSKKMYRPRSIGNVIGELRYIKENMPFIKEVLFEDDTFTADKKRTREICNEIIENKIKINWSCNSRVDLDYDTMKLMKKAGCRLLCVGFESPNEKSLNDISKSINNKEQISFAKEAKRAGLLINGCFILGLPNDNKDSIKKTIEYAKKLSPNTAQFYPLMVYPGTESYKWAKSNGYLKTENWADWLTKEGLHNTTVSYDELSSEEIMIACDKARLDFYTDPKYISKMIIQSIKDPHEALRMYKSGKVFAKYLIDYIRRSKELKIK
ncbi:hypothetical protein CR164_11685 [Prosthecochloris marina]|uniref:Uncharacterized protein n=1 Tax=Prosthecochloris marina TaxID=2017681 RepID=A0A317T3M8_9CHLB|nr:radical SAM protein [Prosthecochloris marina]PWW81194.1 hypothetical protein CR164_11685 [Prosthecochloris marina]